LVIAAAALVAYFNSFAGPFVFDDEPSILSNPSIRSLWRAWSPPVNGGITPAGRPVLNFTLAVNYAISGMAPWSYHALNLLIHLLAGLTLFGVVRRTLEQPILCGRSLLAGDSSRASSFQQSNTLPIAFTVALLWTVHPLQTESVTYVVQRAESLMGLFFLLTLYCFIRGTEYSTVGTTKTPRHEAGVSTNRVSFVSLCLRGSRSGSASWFALSILSCLAGMGTKEVMAVAPLIVLLYDRTFVAGSFRAAWRERCRLYLALAATWVLLGWLVLGAGDRGGSFDLDAPRTWWRYDLTQFVAVIRYLRLAVWPHPLAIDYGTFWIEHPFAILPHMVIVLALLAATVVALVRWPVWGFLGSWFFLILAPSSVLPGTVQMIVEHRMYLPLAVVMVIAATAGFAYLGGKKGVVFLSAAALALTALTARRNQDYASAIGLFEDTVAKRPGNARAMALLADYYHRAGQLEKARQSLERSIEVQPGVVQVLNNLGNVWQELGESGKAVGCFQRALALDPRAAVTRNNLGNALILSGEVSQGIAELEAAVRLEPDSAGTRLNLANSLAQNGRMPEAAENFEALLKAQPDNADAQANYGRVLEALGRRAEAVAHLENAVGLRSEDADLRNRLGATLGRAGRVPEALAQFEEALRLNPAHEEARQNAARARRMLGGN
jgi:tetratricopeptide (TPR) repeat protein